MFTTDLELRATSQPDFWAVVSPKFLRNIFDPNGYSREPAVMHDWNYRTHLMTRAQCDQLLHDSLVACGESKTVAWCYKSGVRLGGAGPYGAHPFGVQAFDFDNIANFNAWRATQ
jgi:hypothetical protein